MTHSILVNIEGEGTEWLEWAAALYESYYADIERDEAYEVWSVADAMGYDREAASVTRIATREYAHAAETVAELLEYERYGESS
jgi:hypothetical protein